MNGHRSLSLTDLLFHRHHDELREYWQAKALLHTRAKPIGSVLLSVLAHAYGIDAMRTLMKVCFPGFENIRPPFYCSCGKVMTDGSIVADVMHTDGSKEQRALVFRDLAALQSAFRTLADELKLNDTDRTALFDAVRQWIVADFRRDPTRNEEAA